MGKRKKRAGEGRSRRPAPPPEVGAVKPSSAAGPVKGWNRRLAAGVVALLVIGGIVLYRSLGERKPIPVAPVAGGQLAAHYAGGKACAQCHAKEYEAWQGSHHDLAMQEANEQTVLGNFANAKFSYAGIISTFFKRDGKFYVNTDGQDGKLTDYESSTPSASRPYSSI